MPDKPIDTPNPPAAPEPDEDFPGLVKPDLKNPTHFQQPTRVGDHERMLAKDAGDEDIYAEPSRQAHPGTAEDHKAFLDSKQVRTEEQGIREDGDRPKSGGTPGGGDVDHNQSTPSKPASNPSAKTQPGGKR